nr:PREDICTED: uncharacterized protein LOC105272895 [Fopius arisanus]
MAREKQRQFRERELEKKRFQSSQESPDMFEDIQLPLDIIPMTPETPAISNLLLEYEGDAAQDGSWNKPSFTSQGRRKTTQELEAMLTEVSADLEKKKAKPMLSQRQQQIADIDRELAKSASDDEFAHQTLDFDPLEEINERAEAAPTPPEPAGFVP